MVARPRGARSARLLAIVLLLSLLTVAVWWLTEPLRPAETVYPVTATELRHARALLDGLTVREPVGEPRYDRGAFGTAWSDEDRNGCDTRNDVLGAQLLDPVRQPGTHGCVVLAGVLEDRYTGATIDFRRGEGTSALVQIDHVVALADAWYKGASAWDAGTRRAFANDPANLLAVDGPTNQDKGAADAAEWLPPNAGFRCQYVILQIRVKADYELWASRAEHRAFARELDRCEVLS